MSSPLRNVRSPIPGLDYNERQDSLYQEPFGRGSDEVEQRFEFLWGQSRFIFVQNIAKNRRSQKPLEQHTAVYVRVSSLDQRQDSQVKELKNYTRLRRWSNLAFYQDKLSGAEVARPELDRMMSDVRAGRVERVICFKLDRLGRSVSHLALLMEELIRLHVPLIATSQGIDTSEDNAAGRLQAHVIMAMAEFERSLIRERVHAGLAAARERGVRLGRQPVLMERVEEVKRLKKAGLGIRAIGRKLGMPPSSVHKVWRLAIAAPPSRTDLEHQTRRR